MAKRQNKTDRYILKFHVTQHHKSQKLSRLQSLGLATYVSPTKALVIFVHVPQITQKCELKLCYIYTEHLHITFQKKSDTYPKALQLILI